eukprot:s244_g16.t1
MRWLGKTIAQQRISIDIGGAGKRQGKVAAREGTEKSEKPATGLYAQHDERAASGVAEFEGTSDGVCAAQRCRLTSPGDGANDGGVYGLLRAMPESKSVRDDLDAAVVSNRHIDIHVGQADITGNTRAGFLADPRSSPSKEGGPGRRARRKLRRQPCDRRVGRGPRQAHVRGATGSGTRSRRSIRTRNKGEVTVSSAEVGKAVKARAACGPACDSSSARDAASGWERRCEGSARQHPKQIVCTRRGTKQQEEPRRLQIADSRETAEQLVLDHAFAAELTAHESFTPQLCFASAGKNGPFRHADSTATTAFLPSASSHTSNLSHPSDYATLDSMAEATMRMGLSAHLVLPPFTNSWAPVPLRIEGVWDGLGLFWASCADTILPFLAHRPVREAEQEHIAKVSCETDVFEAQKPSRVQSPALPALSLRPGREPWSPDSFASLRRTCREPEAFAWLGQVKRLFKRAHTGAELLYQNNHRRRMFTCCS